jgi:hypothetical protein
MRILLIKTPHQVRGSEVEYVRSSEVEYKREVLCHLASECDAGSASPKKVRYVLRSQIPCRAFHALPR